jgi:hypothetical protein
MPLLTVPKTADLVCLGSGTELGAAGTSLRCRSGRKTVDFLVVRVSCVIHGDEVRAVRLILWNGPASMNGGYGTEG